MISYIRNNRKALAIVLWFVIFAFVATIFVVWGIGERNNTQSYVAIVGDETLSYNDFNELYRQTEQFRGLVEIKDLEKKVLETAIGFKLLNKRAIELDIPVTDSEMIASISNIDAFKDQEGRFSFDRYESILKAQGINIENFEANLKAEIRRSKLIDIITSTQSVVSDKELENEYNYRKSKLTVSYFGLPFSKFDKNQKPTDAELLEYYEKEKAKYKVPSEIKVRYITFDKNDFASTFDISDEVAKSYYDQNKVRYIDNESADISMVVVPFNSTDNASREAAREKIMQAMQELKDGKSFASVATKYSDKEMVQEEGYFGKVERGTLQVEIENAAFNTKEGEYSDIVSLPGTFLILRVNKLNAKKEWSFEEKKAEIKENIKNDSLTNAFNGFVLEEYKKIASVGNISSYKAANPDAKIDIIELDFVKEDALFPIIAISINPTNKNNLYALEKGELSNIVSDGSLSYIFEIADKKKSYIPKLEDVKEEVNANYVADKLSSEAITALSSVKDIVAASKEYDISLEESTFSRDNITDVTISENEVVLASVTKAKKGEITKPIALADKVYIFHIDDIKEADFKMITDSERNEIIQYISNIKSEVALKSYIDDLKSKVKIKYNEDFLKSMNITIN